MICFQVGQCVVFHHRATLKVGTGCGVQGAGGPGSGRGRRVVVWVMAVRAPIFLRSSCTSPSPQRVEIALKMS